jgi:hypothetical protein
MNVFAASLVEDVEIALAAHVRFCRDHPETLQRISIRVKASGSGPVATYTDRLPTLAWR